MIRYIYLISSEASDFEFGKITIGRPYRAINGLPMSISHSNSFSPIFIVFPIGSGIVIPYSTDGAQAEIVVFGL